MADIRNCNKCGKIFAFFRSTICPACQQLEEAEFEIVKEYVYENPGMNISIISEETGIPMEKILKFLKDERLELSSEVNNLILECERCNKPVKSGRYCAKCKVDLETGFKKEFGIGNLNSSPDSKKDNKMFTISRIKDNK